MAQAAIHAPSSSRLRSLVVPREHGAWGILSIPLATGGSVGLLRDGRVAPVLLFAAVALALFCMHTPMESLLGLSLLRVQTKAERRSVGLIVAGLAAVAILALAGLLRDGRNQGLWVIGAIAAVSFFLQGILRKLGRQVRMSAQMAGALGLTSTAAGAYYVATQQFDFVAISLWFANWIFVGNQIHFVQLRIHHARLASRKAKLSAGKTFIAGQLVMMLVLLSIWHFGLLPGLAIVAFVPVFARGVSWFFRGPEALQVHRLGVTELAHALVFGLLLVMSYRLG